MSALLFLDTAVLGMITNPKASEQTRECYSWFEAHWASGVRIVIPEIADYELRRELLRMGRMEAIARLNALEERVEYAPITTNAMLTAAKFWAEARKKGYPTAPEDALDGDVILAAQASTWQAEQDRSLIATTNVKHLILFVDAQLWSEIRLS